MAEKTQAVSDGVADTPQVHRRRCFGWLTPRRAALAASLAFLPAALVGFGPDERSRQNQNHARVDLKQEEPQRNFVAEAAAVSQDIGPEDSGFEPTPMELMPTTSQGYSPFLLLSFGAILEDARSDLTALWAI